jgi:hypothetical protein
MQHGMGEGLTGKSIFFPQLDKKKRSKEHVSEYNFIVFDNKCTMLISSFRIIQIKALAAMKKTIRWANLYSKILILCGLALILPLVGHSMTKDSEQEWFPLVDQESGLRAFFPRQPFTMAFDIPFTNTPAYGKIRFYTMPLENGALVLSIFHHSKGSSSSVEKNDLRRFFEDTVISHLFFHPSIFKNEQKYVHSLQVHGGEITAHFEFTFVENGATKIVHGIAQNKEGLLFSLFYLGDVKNFDQDLVDHFLESYEFNFPNLQ